MKYYFFLVLLYSIIYIKAEDDIEYGDICSTYTSDNDCYKLTEKVAPQYCCVLKAKTSEETPVIRCLKFSPPRDEDLIETYENELETEKSLKEVSIDCGSNSEPKSGTESNSRSDSKYLQLGIFSLIFLIINL